MGKQDEQLSVDQPAIYRIIIQGRLSPAWSTRFDDMTVSVEDGSVQPVRTVLTGCVADQAALYGLLSRVRDLSLPLLSVEFLGKEQGASHDNL